MGTLPSGEEIIGKLISIRTLQEKDVPSLRDWAFETTQSIQAEITKHITNSEFKSDPDTYQDRLYKYHYLMGGMSGLVTALYDKVYVLSYRKLTEASRTDAAVAKQKLTAGDREVYAKDDSADLKGLKLIIEEAISNLQTRMYGVKSSKRW